MQITIACGSMPFGPNSLTTRSLGGSESSALLLAKELRKRDHTVTMFCILPQPGEPDYIASGSIAEDGVRYVDLEKFQNFTATNECDLSIIVRDPNLAGFLTQARKKVLWMHDIATKRGMQRAFDQMSFAVDEVWTVSEWHRQQVHAATGFPLDFIVPLRNGIAKHEGILDVPRIPKQILYAARPERGLDNLLKPGGIMDALPEYTLKVAMYEHFPEHMRDYYEQIFARMKEMPNVDYIGGKSNAELRQIIRESAAYIYPTQFEETSCILARECIEQGTPILTTRVGALPETVQDCGSYFEDYLAELGYIEPEKGSVAWCRLFAQFFRDAMSIPALLEGMATNQSVRDDLYWDGVAEMVEARAPDNSTKKVFSVAWSMIEDGDVIAAREYLAYHGANDFTNRLVQDIENEYPFILDPANPKYVSLKDYYDHIYVSKGPTETSELVFRDDMTQGNRYRSIYQALNSLPPGQKVIEYGCGPGHLLAALARHLPQHSFFGVEISPAAVECLNAGAEKAGLKNIQAIQGDENTRFYDDVQSFDVAICSEVLEHVPEPWKLAEKVESFVKEGGKVIFTVPFGPWEPLTFKAPGRFHERAHIWLLDRHALRAMFEDKQDKGLLVQVNQQPGVRYGRVTGNYILSFTADHQPVKPLDVVNKWRTHNTRETVAAAIIAMNNEDTILRCLESIKDQVQIIQIAHGPSNDKTREIIDKFAADYPYIYVNVIDVPKIEPYHYGFDDARNASIAGLDDVVDWILWIDTDEYLSGDYTPYLRANHYDCYIIPQHHFTVEPRGGPPQIDKPGRLFRTGRGFRALGHIHEHFEVEGGGPGRAYELQRVDIGHTGYVDEDVRQARFRRNFEFLQWDHETQPDARKLHHFLWFRDMIHWMRIYHKEGKADLATQVAKEAVAYYNEHWEVMSTFGPGFVMSQQYLSEACNYLGRGTPLQVMVAFEDRQAAIQGRFENYEQVERLFKFLIGQELKDRSSRYF